VELCSHGIIRCYVEIFCSEYSVLSFAKQHSLMVVHTIFLVRDEKRFCVAPFMRVSLFFRDTVGHHQSLNALSRSEVSCIVNYLATTQLLTLFAFTSCFYCATCTTSL